MYNSWSLGQDYEQEYAEVTSFVFSPAMPEVTYNPSYVLDILCPSPSGELESIFGLEQRCHFVAKNGKFLAGIEYPTTTNFASRILAERDSLVTKSLLDLTSYSSGFEPKFEKYARAFDPDIIIKAEDGIFAETDEADNNNNNVISFEELGQVYKNISRSQILSNVNYCSNVHFHAHPDGSTTIHKHKACSTLDPGRKISSDSRKINSYELVPDLQSDSDEVYSSLGNGPRPLPVPPRGLSPQCTCDSREAVCDMEGGIKFNPCFDDNKPCDIMLEAAWQAGQTTAAHASRCDQCAQFSSKIRQDFSNIDNLDTVERGLHYGGVAMVPFPPYPLKHYSSVDRNIKLVAYLSVIVLAVLLLILVIIVLSVFFQHYAA